MNFLERNLKKVEQVSTERKSKLRSEIGAPLKDRQDFKSILSVINAMKRSVIYSKTNAYLNNDYDLVKMYEMFLKFLNMLENDNKIEPRLEMIEPRDQNKKRTSEMLVETKDELSLSIDAFSRNLVQSLLKNVDNGYDNFF